MLQKQTITIPLGLGVNTKADEKLVEQGAFNLVCENAVFEKVGAVKKRDAYKTLAVSYYDKSAAAGGGPNGNYSAETYYPTCAAALGKSLFLRNQIGEYWYQYNDSFVLNDALPVPEFKVTSVTAYTSPTTIDHTDTDYDSNENILLAVGREGNLNADLAGHASNASTLVLYDLATESKTVTNSIPGGAFASTFGFVRCGFTRVSGQSFYYNVTVDTAGVLQVKIFNKYGQENPASISVSGIRTAGAVNVGGIAVCRAFNDQYLFIFCNTTTNNLGKVIAISGTTKMFESTFATTSAFMSSMSAKEQSGLVYLAYANRQIIFNATGTVNTADAALAGSTLTSVAYDQDSVARMFGRVSGGYSSYIGGTQSRENDNTLLVSDKVTLSGIPFVVGRSYEGSNINNEASYFALGYAAGSGRSGQKTYARFCTSNALAPSRESYYQVIPARFAKISETKAAIALPQFSNETGLGLTYQMQLFFIEVNQDHASNSRAILGKNLHLQGGFLAEFDGISLFENGFHLPPALPILDTTAAGALTGTYTYKVVLRYTDKNGQITRSAPSPQISTGSITSKKVAITINTTPFGIKAKNCVAEIYRTKNNGSSFYYLTETAVDMYSAVSILLATDEATDATIGSNAFLYTEGNILQNNPAPANKGVCQGGNRVFVWGLEDENEVAYSKKKLFGEAVNFSDLFRIRFDSAQFSISGGVTACGYMDDKLIGFKKNSVFYVSGDGPNETGLGAFSDPELITSDTGCTDPRSVVLTPLGLMFKGQKGIYLLDRGLNTKYIGSEVEAYNSFNVVSACHIDKKNQVIFSLTSSDTSEKYQLVYDYFTQQWSVAKGLRALDADVLSGSHVVLESDLKAPQVQNGSDFLDNTSPYSVRILTPWIKVSGIQDFARIWTAIILGKYRDTHVLRVKVYYDYTTDYSETFDITPNSSDAQYQYLVHLKKQKCEAVQFEIQDLSQTGESMELTALTLEVGLRKGSKKLAASRKY
jgi:hypothetical protein